MARALSTASGSAAKRHQHEPGKDDSGAGQA
jgi:hypothetical protein